ncbi:MAG: NADH-quinone oxidoreductase subunit L [Thermodesulfobacteriota bacterium]
MAAILTTWLPFISFLLIIAFTRNHRRLSGGIAIAAVAGSLAGSVFLLARHWGAAQPIHYAAKWLIAGDVSIPFGFLLDPLSLLMLSLVAAISLLVQVYSLGYMACDPGFSRYYAFQSLFAWAMMTLSISSDMLQLYVFWELVGLSSYLLIGFWYEKFSATQAGKKAFVMTRLGDVSFFIGLLLVLFHLGNLGILEMNSPEAASRMPSGLLTLAALLIFGGIVGKSAQFPLMTWLPDAMEGPTPVSALFHSATMVAAGVYLFARLFPFLGHSADAMTVFLAIGTVSMLLASTMAMVSRDIKQVWAYSTISQLGFMIMGLAAGSFFAGSFHLTTHAGFKALLFLCSGVWVHLYETNDVYEISMRGGRRLKTPMVCLVIAAAALSGLPPLSGFFSKEVILAALAGLENPVWLAAGLLGVFLTAYYTFRVIFIILFPRGQIQEEPGHHGMEGKGTLYWAMGLPLLILAGVTLVLGFLETPVRQFLLKATVSYLDSRHVWLPYFSMGLAALGIGIAWFEFGRSTALQVGFVERVQPLRELFIQRWYLDHLYRWVVDTVIDRILSRGCTKNENRVINDGIDGFCRVTLDSSRFLAFLQSGKLRYNLFVMFAALALVALYFLFA